MLTLLWRFFLHNCKLKHNSLIWLNEYNFCFLSFSQYVGVKVLTNADIKKPSECLRADQDEEGKQFYCKSNKWTLTQTNVD